MDFGNFLESLNKAYKEMAISLFLIFPLAYIDCWKLHPEFQNIELIPQLFLCGGVSVMALLAGVAVSFWFSVASLSYKKLYEIDPENSNIVINMVGIVLPFAICSANVLIGSIKTLTSFELVYLGVGLTGCGYLYVSRLISQKSNKRKSTNTLECQTNE